MKDMIKLEELFLFFLAIFLFAGVDIAWWWYLVLFFTPDLSMLGYLHSPATGALTYNLIHHKGLAVAAYILGSLLGNPVIQLTGLVLLGHSSLDRVLGYGLKFADAFSHTHLGMIGRAAANRTA